MTLLRVLVVEDDALIAMLLAETVIGLGHTVCAIVAAESEAVAAADSLQPDMIIVDAGLNEGNGVSAMKTILRTRFVPHVYVTGDPSAVLAVRPGAVVLQKPFFEHELVRAIGIALTVKVTS